MKKNKTSNFKQISKKSLYSTIHQGVSKIYSKVLVLCDGEDVLWIWISLFFSLLSNLYVHMWVLSDVWAAEAPFSDNFVHLPRGNRRINISRKFNLLKWFISSLIKKILWWMDGWTSLTDLILVETNAVVCLTSNRGRGSLFSIFDLGSRHRQPRTRSHLAWYFFSKYFFKDYIIHCRI